jgi:ankyrin repeat protein
MSAFPPSEPDSPAARLLDAARVGDIGAIRATLAEGADNLDAALVVACGQGQTAAAAYLLDRGAALDARSWTQEGEGSGLGVDTPLTAAAAGGHLETVLLLLERGADINARAAFAPAEPQDDPAPEHPWHTALTAAAQFGQAEVVAFLLERGAGDRNEALREAAQHNRPEPARLLLAGGASPNARIPWMGEEGEPSDFETSSPLGAAICFGDGSLLRLLLDAGANLQADGAESLRLAILRGRPEQVDELLRRGVPLNQPEIRLLRRNPTHYFFNVREHDATLAILRRHGYRPGLAERFWRRARWLTIGFFWTLIILLALGVILVLSVIGIFSWMGRLLAGSWRLTRGAARSFGRLIRIDRPLS